VRQLAELRDRVTQVEERVEQWQTTLNGHTNTLNAIRDNQLDLGEKVSDLGEKVAEQGEKLDRLEAKMRDGFGNLAKGQELITGLLTRHLHEPNEETGAGDADE
jgi:uncharacterized coiled-coil protein SlyX